MISPSNALHSSSDKAQLSWTPLTKPLQICLPNCSKPSRTGTEWIDRNIPNTIGFHPLASPATTHLRKRCIMR